MSRLSWNKDSTANDFRNWASGFEGLGLVEERKVDEISPSDIKNTESSKQMSAFPKLLRLMRARVQYWQ